MILDTIYAFFAEHIIGLMYTLPIITINAALLQGYYNVVDLILTNTTLLGLFIRPSTLVSVSITVLAIINFEHIYNIAMWIKRKIKP